MVFVAFMQQCIQSNVTHVGGDGSVKYFTEQMIKGYVGGVKGVLCIQWPLAPSRREGYLKFLSCGFTTSQSREAALLTFWDLSTTRVIAGKTHSQSPILKTKGCSATQ